MSWSFWIGCNGRRQKSLPTDDVPPAPQAPATLVALPGVAALSLVQDEHRRNQHAWHIAMRPPAFDRYESLSHSPLRIRCRLLQRMRQNGSSPPGIELGWALKEGIDELRLEGRWAEAAARGSLGKRPSAAAVADKASLLLQTFGSPAQQHRIGNAALLSLLQVRDASLCRRGTGLAESRAIDALVAAHAFLSRPLIVEAALACVPGGPQPVRGQLPYLQLDDADQHFLCQRVRQRVQLLHMPPIGSAAVAEVLEGGRLRLLEECSALASSIGVQATAAMRGRLCRSCLFDLQDVERLPWRSSDEHDWPPQELARAWRAHRARLFRLFPEQRAWIEAELNTLEGRIAERHLNVPRNVLSPAEAA